MATYTAVAGGGNWSSAATWGGAGFPIAGDTAIIDGTLGSGNTVTVDVASACTTLNMTNAVGTLAFGTQTLTVSGLATLKSKMTSTSGVLKVSGVSGGVTLLSTVTGSFPTLEITASGTFTSNGYTWPGALTFSTSSTLALGLADDMTITGLILFNVRVVFGNNHLITANGGITFATTTGATDLSGNIDCNGALTVQTGPAIVNTSTGKELRISGNLTLSAQPLSGTANIILDGTGTWSGSGATTIVSNNLTINTAGTITLGTGCLYGTGTITKIAGTVSGTLGINNSATIANAAGQTWAGIAVAVTTSTLTLSNDLTLTGILTLRSSITFSGAYNITCGALTCNIAGTHTLSGNIDCNGTFLVSVGSVIINGAFNINISGNLTLSGQPLSGTANIILDGTGTWSGTTAAAIVSNNLTINTAGTITLGTNVYYKTGTLTYTAGTIAGTGTLNIMGNSTLSGWGGASGTRFNNLTVGLTSTITLGSALVLGGVMTLSAATTFSGAYSITTPTFTVSIAGPHTLSDTIYVTGTFSPTVSTTINGSGKTIACDKFILPSTVSLTLGAGLILDVATYLYVNGASGVSPSLLSDTPSSSAILTYRGTLANCKIFLLTATDIDASSSAVTLYDWMGTTTRCNKLVDVTGGNIGGAGVQCVCF